MPKVIVDGIEVELAAGERINGIQAAQRAGVEIPHYCWHAGLTVVASCRMCLVETGTRNPDTGDVTMVPKLVPACQTPATPNTVFITNSQQVANARAMVEEDLLIDHPIDCPICHDAALAGHYLTPGPAWVLAPIVVVMWRFTADGAAKGRRARSHDWRSRAPPIARA